MGLKLLNLRRIARRRLARQPPPRSRTGLRWSTTVNRLVRDGNLAGLIVVTLLIAALVGQAVTGDCVAAWLADHAIAQLAVVYEPFAIGLVLTQAPGAIAVFTNLSARLASRTDPDVRTRASRDIAAAWLRDDPVLPALAALAGSMIMVYGVSALTETLLAHAHWVHSAARHADATAACTLPPDVTAP
jgi:hypothetical protein